MRISIIFLSLISLAAQAAMDEFSAHRRPGVSYQRYMQEARARMRSGEVFEESPLSVAQYYSRALEAGLPKATNWTSQSLTKRRFTQLRDDRSLVWRKQPDFRRRISWLYPDDGCYARASMVMRAAVKRSLPVPKKVFAFGDLRASTRNSPTGYVTWWYHVAPVVEVKKQKYVLDPAIEPKGPLRLRDWLARMGTPERMEVAVCNSGTYGPSSNCEALTDGVEQQAGQTQDYFLTLEWDRLVELSRDPRRELGANPPW